MSDYRTEDGLLMIRTATKARVNKTFIFLAHPLLLAEIVPILLSLRVKRFPAKNVANEKRRTEQMLLLTRQNTEHS